MNKKILSLLICLILMISISTCAFATNVDKIQPDGNVIVVGVTNYDVPVYGHLPTHYNAGDNTTVVIGGYYVWYDDAYIATNHNNNNNNNNTNTNTETNNAPEEQKVTEDRPASVLAGEIFDLVNYYRVTNGVENLVYNKNLQDAADVRAKESAESFSHTRPDGTDFATAITIDYTKAGENLLLVDKVIADYEVIVDTWMNSAGHKANILDGSFHSTAIGIYEKDEVLYISQLFLN